MEEKRAYCPNCGHKFVQGEYNYNYETGLLDYTCPDCDFEGTEHAIIDEDKIIDDLTDKVDDGIEITPEDAAAVMDKIEDGYDYSDALDEVAEGIEDCLDEDIDLSDKLEMYNGSYNKRTLKNEGLCIVTWPDSQELCEMPNFWEHAWLINDDYGLRRFGSCAYVVEENWFYGE